MPWNARGSGCYAASSAVTIRSRGIVAIYERPNPIRLDRRTILDRRALPRRLRGDARRGQLLHPGQQGAWHAHVRRACRGQPHHRHRWPHLHRPVLRPRRGTARPRPSGDRRRPGDRGPDRLPFRLRNDPPRGAGAAGVPVGSVGGPGAVLLLRIGGDAAPHPRLPRSYRPRQDHPHRGPLPRLPRADLHRRPSAGRPAGAQSHAAVPGVARASRASSRA